MNATKRELPERCLPYREKRAATGLKQADICKRIGLPVRTLAGWETGMAYPPEWLERLYFFYLDNFRQNEAEENQQESSQYFGNTKKLRKAYGLTQDGLAALIGLPKRTVESWDGGQRGAADYIVFLIWFFLEKNIKK